MNRRILCAGTAVLLSVALLSGCATLDAVQPGAETSAPENGASSASETSAASVSETSTAAGVAGAVDAASIEFKKKDYYSDYTGAVEIDLSNPVSGTGYTVAGGVITITADGTYLLSGTLADGQVVIAAGEADDVRLVLNGAQITCSTSAPIYAKSADKVIISTAPGTENSVADTVTATDGADELTGAIFAKCDLSFNGEGTLTVYANANDGVTTKDDFKMTSGTLRIEAADDGIVGKDAVLVSGGTLDITAAGDGVKSTSTDAGQGIVYVADGVLSIDAGCDGLQAETSLLIAGGTVDIVTGGGSANAPAKTEAAMFGGWQSSASNTDTASEKGVKAELYLDVTGGVLTLDTTDDAVHCNGTLRITGGTLTAASGDDGMHADSALVIDGGTVTITQSYEGIEAGEIEVNGGTIDVTASDDGFNAAGGADSSSMNGRMGQNAFDADASKTLTMNGGTVIVNAGGDGLDSNGALTINGGEIYVSGPTDGANGTFDSGTSFTVNGGVLVGLGSLGMLETPGADSAQQSLTLSVSGSAGDTVELRDASGNTLASYTAAKSFAAATFSTPEIAVGETYTVYVNGSAAASIESTGTVTGGAGGQMGGQMGGPMGAPPVS